MWCVSRVEATAAAWDVVQILPGLPPTADASSSAVAFHRALARVAPEATVGRGTSVLQNRWTLMARGVASGFKCRQAGGLFGGQAVDLGVCLERQRAIRLNFFWLTARPFRACTARGTPLRNLESLGLGPAEPLVEHLAGDQLWGPEAVACHPVIAGLPASPETPHQPRPRTPPKGPGTCPLGARRGAWRSLTALLAQARHNRQSQCLLSRVSAALSDRATACPFLDILPLRRRLPLAESRHGNGIIMCNRQIP